MVTGPLGGTTRGPQKLLLGRKTPFLLGNCTQNWVKNLTFSSKILISTNKLGFGSFMVNSSNELAWEHRLTTFPKKSCWDPYRSPSKGAIVVLKSLQNTKGEKIHSFWDRKLKLGMQIDRMTKKYVRNPRGLKAPLGLLKITPGLLNPYLSRYQLKSWCLITRLSMKSLADGILCLWTSGTPIFCQGTLKVNPWGCWKSPLGF